MPGIDSSEIDEAMTATDKSHISAQLLETCSEQCLIHLRRTPTCSYGLPRKPQVAHGTGPIAAVWLTSTGSPISSNWFMEFAGARNSIIHNGITPALTYNEPNSEYNGHFVFTAEFLLRAVIKVSLGTLGYPDLWRSETWRIVKATYEKLCAQEAAQAAAGAEPAAAQ